MPVESEGAEKPHNAKKTIAIVLGCIYGFFMGWYALLSWNERQQALLQVFATTVKLPALFLLTLGALSDDDA